MAEQQEHVVSRVELWVVVLLGGGWCAFGHRGRVGIGYLDEVLMVFWAWVVGGELGAL